MALSLSSERSLAAASPAHPFAALARWIAQAKAARTRRVALQALLELDHARLYDLGISRQDIRTALERIGEVVVEEDPGRRHHVNQPCPRWSRDCSARR